MNLDITAIVTEKMNQMENDGAIRKMIEENVEKSVREAIKSAVGGYALQREIEAELIKQFPEIVKDIGISAYNTFIAETVKKLVIAELQGDARQKINDRVEEILLKKREEIKLSEILKEWREEVNDKCGMDDDDKRSANEEGGYTCRVVKDRVGGYATYYLLYFDEEGDIDSTDPEDYELKVKLRWLLPETYNYAEIVEVYFHGDRLSKQFVSETPTAFGALLMNLYLNKTHIIMDLDSYDEDDHYYEVEEP